MKNQNTFKYPITSRWSTTAATTVEVVQLLAENGRWWLIPMFGVMLMAAVLLVVVQAVEYVAPFIYTIF
jgi:hypothetical protein